jgi:hypothetical protein
MEDTTNPNRTLGTGTDPHTIQTKRRGMPTSAFISRKRKKIVSETQSNPSESSQIRRTPSEWSGAHRSHPPQFPSFHPRLPGFTQTRPGSIAGPVLVTALLNTEVETAKPPLCRYNVRSSCTLADDRLPAPGIGSFCCLVHICPSWPHPFSDRSQPSTSLSARLPNAPWCQVYHCCRPTVVHIFDSPGRILSRIAHYSLLPFSRVPYSRPYYVVLYRLDSQWP